MEKISNISNLGQKVLNGDPITRQEAAGLAETDINDFPFLLAMANKIRQRFLGDSVELCAIINGRSGLCSEDCHFCAQSSYYNTNIEEYFIKPEHDVLKAAKMAEEAGAARFSVVTSGRGSDQDKEFPKILQMLTRIKAQTGLKVCASLGSLSAKHAQELKAAGVSRYHHNLETSRSYYQNICSTHNYDTRIQTIKIAQEAGLEVCSGGIIGLGETWEHRLEMAFELREYRVQSIPINVLIPIKGTPLQNQTPLKAWDVLKTLALFRFILPDRCIRIAGGRELVLRDLQAMALLSGMSGMMIGGYLTTGGRSVDADLQMIKDLGRILSGEVGPNAV